MNAIAMTKVLIVLTSHSQLGTTGKQTGYYLPEVSHPTQVLERAGFEVDFVSPQGGKAPMDEGSRDLTDPANRAVLEREDLIFKLENTLRPDQVRTEEYAAILFAGGHGTMWDFADNKQLSTIAQKIFEQGGVVAAVCHGPAGLVNIKLSNGDYLVAGKKVAAFSNDEEAAAGLTNIVPFLLESALRDRGALYSKAGLWQKHVVIDGRLVTGQNPASAAGVGAGILTALGKK